MNPVWSILVAGWLAGLTGTGRGWVAVPLHDTRQGPAGAFDLGRCEVSVAEFQTYLNDAEIGDYPDTDQIHRRTSGEYTGRRGVSRQAVANVTLAEAEGYCRWLSAKTGRKIRLPRETEWEMAARGGVDGAPYPWGWGGSPAKLARFDAAGPAKRGRLFPPNGFGLYDMAGNVYEWCATGRNLPAGMGSARGGSWAERDPALLDPCRQQEFPADYRGRDVGFRVLREWKKE